MVDQIKQIAVCSKCNKLITSITEAKACCECGAVFCKKCIDESKENGVKTCMMNCSDEPFAGRKLTKFEQGQVQTLKFVNNQNGKFKDKLSSILNK